MILFSAIDHGDCGEAYGFHKAFADSNEAIFPRNFDDFESMVMDGRVWAARDPLHGCIALAYASYDEETKECEIGGLMVSEVSRGKGIGEVIMRLALAHMLIEENLLAIPDIRIVAHVLKSNDMPRTIIENKLKFHHAKDVKIPADALPGLKAEDDGFVHGDEFEITLPDTLNELADWASQWKDQTKDGAPAVIELRTGVSMPLWAKALRQMAVDCQQ